MSEIEDEIRLIYGECPAINAGDTDHCHIRVRCERELGFWISMTDGHVRKDGVIDTEGVENHERPRSYVGGHFTRQQVMAIIVVLNRALAEEKK